jgi:hypothetical protein
VSDKLPPRQGLVAFMVTLAGPDPAGLLELRHRRRDRSGMRQRFFDKPQAAAMAATVLSQTGDVYVGCAPAPGERAARTQSSKAGRCGSTATTPRRSPRSSASSHNPPSWFARVPAARTPTGRSRSRSREPSWKARTAGWPTRSEPA